MTDFQYAQPWHTDFIAKYFVAGPSRVAKLVSADKLADQQQVLIDHAIRENVINAPYSLMVNIPFCNQACQYQGNIGSPQLSSNELNDYFDSLRSEMAFFKPYFSNRPVKRLHIGGCTAAILEDKQLHSLAVMLREHYEMLADDIGHYSIDVDAMQVTDAQLTLIRELGFNHVRFCVQSTAAHEHLGANLDSRFQHIKSLRRTAKLTQFETVEVALAYGFPGQTAKSFADILEFTCNLHPSRISLQPYTSRCNPDSRYPATPIMDRHLNSTLELIETSVARITRSGYKQIGIDLFARKNDALYKAKMQGTLTKGLLGYSPVQQQDVLGIGVSSVTCLGNLVVQNTPSYAKYQEMVDNRALPIEESYHYDTHDRIRATFISQLICQGFVDFAKLDDSFDIDSRSYLTDRIAELDAMVKDGLIDVSAKGIAITKTGELLLRPICMVLDHWMQKRGKHYF